MRTNLFKPASFVFSFSTNIAVHDIKENISIGHRLYQKKEKRNLERFASIKLLLIHNAIPEMRPEIVRKEKPRYTLCVYDYTPPYSRS